MKRVETYLLDNDITPTVEHIQQCIDIAKEKDCIVKLEWIMKWSGHYSRYIYAEDDAVEVYNNRLPQVYGM